MANKKCAVFSMNRKMNIYNHARNVYLRCAYTRDMGSRCRVMCILTDSKYSSQCERFAVIYSSAFLSSFRKPRDIIIGKTFAGKYLGGVRVKERREPRTILRRTRRACFMTRAFATFLELSRRLSAG